MISQNVTILHEITVINGNFMKIRAPMLKNQWGSQARIDHLCDIILSKMFIIEKSDVQSSGIN